MRNRYSPLHATPSLGLSLAASVQLYTTEPLPERSIRILILHPAANPSAPIACALFCGPLSSVSGTYEALSYAWGIETAYEPITCDGFPVLIRPNLAAALRQLRHETSDRRLWVDFLCINQTDPGERARQVACMFDVYAQSKQVLLWLGTATPGSVTVMRYIRSLDAEAEVAEHMRWRSRQRVLKPRPHVLEDEPPDEVRTETEDADGENGHETARDTTPSAKINSNGTEPSMRRLPWPVAVGAFLARPWFRRFWVQQEAAACPRTIVLCGQQSVSWDHLFAFAWRMMRGRGQFTPAVARALRSIPPEATISLRLIRLIHTNRQIHHQVRQRSKASLLYVLHAARGCEAADPRDRIYAVQHLARQSAGSAVLLAPDYGISMDQLCIRFAARYVTHRGLAILAFSGRAAQQNTKLPSWVPDWTNTRRHHFMGPATEKAGGGRSAQGRVIGDNTEHPRLVLEAHVFTALESLSGTITGSLRDSYNDDGAATHLPYVAKLEQETYTRFVADPNARYRGRRREPPHLAYARTLVADALPSLPGAAPLTDQCQYWRTNLQLALMQASVENAADGDADTRGTPEPDVTMTGSLADLQLREDTMQRTDSMPSVDYFDEASLEAFSLAEAGEEGLNGVSGQDESAGAALARSVYALNVHKTGTFVHMHVAQAKGGWLTLVPKEARVGDQLAVVKGFGRGLVVRAVDVAANGMGETGDGEDPGPRARYEIIGECYIHGAMRGEMAPSTPTSNDAPTGQTEWTEIEVI